MAPAVSATGTESAGETDLSAFFAAVERGDVDRTRHLVQKLGEAVLTAERAETFGSTALHVAASCGHREMVHVLIGLGAPMEVWVRGHGTPLHSAARHDKVHVARYLIERNANVEALTETGRTPLHCAAWGNSVPIARLLVKAGASVDRVEHVCRDTPLHVAVKRIAVEVAVYLIKSGADMLLPNQKDRTPLQLAVRVNSPDFWGHCDSVRRLLSRDECRSPILLAEAVQCSNLAAVEAMLRAGSSPNVSDETGTTLLHFATRYCFRRILEALLTHGADTEVQDDSGRTPLHLAACAGHEDIVKRLLLSGANIEAKDNEGNTPLACAMHAEHESVADSLLISA